MGGLSMSYKKVNRDPFSNGEDFRWWSARNCDKCIKSPKMVISDLIAYTKCRCAIYRDIELRMCSDEPIAQRTIDICNKAECPYRQTEWKRHKRRKPSNSKGVLNLFSEK